MRPKIFIGSSVEGLKLAYAVQENLEHDANCTVWNQGVFELSGTPLQSLIHALTRFEFAIFIFTPDDTVKIRNIELPSVRDNLIFELGLFIGKLGCDKVFFVMPRGEEPMHLPSDLIGIMPGYYDRTLVDEPMSALGPFCNKVRTQVKKQAECQAGSLKERVIEDSNRTDLGLDITECTIKTISESLVESTEYGVSIDDTGNLCIHISGCNFFQGRLSSAFPGTRELRIIEDPKISVERLLIMFRRPLAFSSIRGVGKKHPIWWSRGPRNMHVESVEKLSDNSLLINNCEFEVKRIAVYNAINYWHSFLYVEVHPSVPTGLYNTPEIHVEESDLPNDCLTEEYALFDGVMIRREEYDDGAAEIQGRVVDVSGAELRKRYLTPYNFIISGIDSPINSARLDRESDIILDGILVGTKTLKDLVEFVTTLTRLEGYILDS